MCGWSLIKNAMQFWFYFKCIMSLGCFASVHGQTTQALDNWWTPPGIPVHICALISIFRLERWENLISPWKYFVCFFPFWRRLENYIRKLESPGNSIWSILASSSRLTDTFRTFYASLLKVIRVFFPKATGQCRSHVWVYCTLIAFWGILWRNFDIYIFRNSPLKFRENLDLKLIFQHDSV